MANFCEHCGTPLHVSDRFCPGCGAPVGKQSGASVGRGGSAGTGASAGTGTSGQREWDAFRSAGSSAYEYESYGETPRETMTVGNWIITLIITCIPIVGFIMLIVWAVGGSSKYPARRNWAIAQFIIAAAIIAISILFFLLFGLTLGTAVSSTGLS